MSQYTPRQGDIILLNFDPQAGHEQRGTRPAFIASNDTFNELTNLALVCPISSTLRNFPLHVPLGGRTKTTGVVLCEQAKALDLGARKAIFFEKAPQQVINEVVDIIIASVEILF